MITKKEVQYIAKLARLGLTEKEVAKYQKELSAILDYFEKLKKVEVSEAELKSPSALVENVTRQDVASAKRRDQSAKLTGMVPETKGGYLKVSPVLGK